MEVKAGKLQASAGNLCVIGVSWHVALIVFSTNCQETYFVAGRAPIVTITIKKNVMKEKRTGE